MFLNSVQYTLYGTILLRDVIILTFLRNLISKLYNFPTEIKPEIALAGIPSFRFIIQLPIKLTYLLNKIWIHFAHSKHLIIVHQVGQAILPIGMIQLLHHTAKMGVVSMKKIILWTTVASLAIGLGILSYSNSSPIDSKNDDAAISKKTQNKVDLIAKKSAPSVIRTDKIEANHARRGGTYFISSVE